MYEYKEETLHNRAFFTFKKDIQDINVAFEPDTSDSYLMIIFSEDGRTISNPHDILFSDTLNHILSSFDDKRGLKYIVAAY